ncbi:heparinase II/III family protein [Pedobacter sp. PLR]|uniref:heparinase II/III domain-containing protein n=1 Tax=Pedobacter sp. PLR TaxID=2994465 RepID=UPI002245EE38|nr:heparinase II/III family protein [Pedobacter sp. PLR]MCX2449744.1 heparinase II/III family protein [Pedobacter sp. PLR]
MNCFKKLVLGFLCLFFSLTLVAQVHPGLMMTKENIPAIRKGVLTYPILKNSYEVVKKDADLALSQPIVVPTPADAGGGYTHEQHKKNYTHILNCGIAWQISGDKKYATYISNILLKYAEAYEKWPLHPKRKDGHQGGRIFWQSLNDFVWQVYTIQGYDLAYDAITAQDRAMIEKHLFKPMMTFFTVDCKETFDKIHNHGTWDIAAVGMTGYVLNIPEYVQMAIKGSNKDGKTGYLAQVDQLFSPDGYYTEGPYYQRYALLPFVIFAKAINNYQPELKIFEYRSQLLAKAINTSLQLTYTNGFFFPINDAIKDKTYESAELVYGVDISYADIKAQPELLDIAEKQGQVVVSDAGLKVATALHENKTKPFVYQSQWIGDGAGGLDGGLGILRYGKNSDQQCLLLKAASQGMGHGHFDRLNILYYDNNVEVFPDYGSARFMNIESKKGGDYLPENKSWAKQTIAHNTLVVDQTSNFKGDWQEAQKHPAVKLYFNKEATRQVASAMEAQAYPGVTMKRTSALVKVPSLAKPLLLDVFQALSSKPHQYDLPFWYNGHLIDASFKINAYTNNLKTLGSKNGYEHIWVNADQTLPASGGYITVLNNKRFYTTHFVTDSPIQVKLLSLGANDPDMNLVESKAFLLSQKQAENQVFFTITEAHGGTNPVTETTVGSASVVTELKIRSADDKSVAVSFKVKGKVYDYRINYQDKDNYIQLTNADITK